MLRGSHFHVLTQKEAIKKAVNNWNNGIFDTRTKLLHMAEQEKILWYATDLLVLPGMG